MIVTVTPSPSIDWTVNVNSFEFAAVNIVASKSREASGKGINVSVALHRNGVETLAVFPAGKETGRFLVTELQAQDVRIVSVESGQDVRTNITLLVPGHSGTKINETGTALPGHILEQILSTCRTTLKQGIDAGQPVMMAICGSLPPGTPEQFHRKLIRLGRELSVPTVVDASGEVLSAAITEQPDLIKPNVHELAHEAGRNIETLGDVMAAAQDLRARGVGSVLASLGADGMMLIDADGALHGQADRVKVVNTVGAGDAALAGFLAGLAVQGDRAACLRSALLYASSAVGHETTLFEVDPSIARRITIDAGFDTAFRLTEPSAGPSRSAIQSTNRAVAANI
ncbi:1-phosphofructokinase family hexose kinase [Arthrobacter sp. APC 3897]|uniref:1-phosphofructokinase family hexose kinase n=1 Tax=Arthrobacter sp. APC 3897 TaxID=3035204 RepID=UPI0025B43639|nr:1-phosphofructokinase family hexose kinase [Arthrobacter sp. APC 3897]MDN3481319.1 1-phosphofructokinase family hexose kinase [Arthrobacter sp. APC 3897]